MHYSFRLPLDESKQIGLIKRILRICEGVINHNKLFVYEL